jgi:E3 ubiquitin-protein ligase RNF14
VSQFSQNAYTCSVCFSSKKGARCLALNCGHIFCRECLQDGWQLYIAEGDVGHVGCLAPTCVKESREANEEEVRRVVTEEEVLRWKWLREKRMFERGALLYQRHSLASMEPHIHRSYYDSLSHGALPGSRSQAGGGRGTSRGLDGMGTAAYMLCVQLFVLLILQAHMVRLQADGWREDAQLTRDRRHGSLVDCPIPLSENIICKYLEHPEGSTGRRELEARFGGRNIARMVSRYLEDKANTEWLESNSMKCPHCNVRVEKSHGCNHVCVPPCQRRTEV